DALRGRADNCSRRQTTPSLPADAVGATRIRVDAALVAGIGTVQHLATRPVDLLTGLAGAAGHARPRASVVAADTVGAIAGQTFGVARTQGAEHFLRGAGVRAFVAVGRAEAILLARAGRLAAHHRVARRQSTVLDRRLQARALLTGARQQIVPPQVAAPR